MDLLDNIVSILEVLFVLFVLGSIIWGATSAFKLKGFVISVGSIALTIFALNLYEKFLNYSLDNRPLLIIIMLVLMAVFLMGITIYALKKEFDIFGYDKEGRKKIKRFLLLSLKQLIVALLSGFALVGIIFFIVWSSNL